MSAGDGLLALAAVLVVGMLGVLIWALSGPWAPPCDGGATGPQLYHGQRIECFHGDVVQVIRRAR